MTDLHALVHEAMCQQTLHAAEIPELDLYVDQIVTLMERAYAPNLRNSGEKPLTKAMINNYSKEGLIRPIKGKKYSREHVLQMLVICSLKNTLSIGEIGRVMKALYADGSFDDQRLADCCERAAALADKRAEALGALLEQTIGETGAEEDAAGLLVTLMTTAALSQRAQLVAEQMVERCFPAPEGKK